MAPNRTPNSYSIGEDVSTIFIRSKGQLLPCLVDTCRLDELLAMTWNLCPSGKRNYAVHRLRSHGKSHTIPMHRYLCGLALGDLQEIDHINQDGMDNRLVNLRIATRSQQMYNVSQPSTCGLRGVYLENPKRAKPWRAQATLNGKKINLGRYLTAQEGHTVAMSFMWKHGLIPITDTSKMSVHPHIDASSQAA